MMAILYLNPEKLVITRAGFPF
jgi:hypothetical protein